MQGVDGRVSLLIECRYKSTKPPDATRPPQTTDQYCLSSDPFPLGTPPLVTFPLVFAAQTLESPDD